MIIPLLVALYLVGRVTFAGLCPRRSATLFGMTLTAAPTVASYLLAAGLMIAGR